MRVSRKFSGPLRTLAVAFGLCAGIAAASAQQPADGVFRYPERVLTPVGTGRDVSFSISQAPQQPLQKQHRPQSSPRRERGVRQIGERPELGKFAVKTNLVYWATLTPNLQIEAAISPRLSIELGGSWTEQSTPDFNYETGTSTDKSLQHWVAKPELRYWFDRPFSKHFVGVNVLYADYNVGGYDIPMLFDKEALYDGTAVGGGVSYGYHWGFSRRLRAEFGLGVGILQMTYDKTEAGAVEAKRFKKTYMGPTQAGVKLIFMIL